MLCPRCHDAFLDEVRRDDVIVDVCRKCRGVWLDRGELEKLRLGGPRAVDGYEPRRYHDVEPRRSHDDDDRHDRRYPRRKKGLVELLGDLID